MNINKIIEMMTELGYELQDGEAYCSFKIVINNCRKKEYYFKEVRP